MTNGFIELENESREISQGRCKPAYLIWGEEFWVREALEKLLDVLIPKSERPFNLESFDGSSPDWERALLGLSTFGFFRSRKVVVIDRIVATKNQPRASKSRDAEDKEGIEPALLKLLDKGLPLDHVLIVTAEKSDPHHALQKKIAQIGRVFSLEAERDPTGRIHRGAADKLLSQALSRARKRIEPVARDLVLARSGRAVRPFHNEIEKLLLYVGEREVVTAEDVQIVFNDLAGAWIFELTQQIGNRAPAGSLRILRDLLGSGEHPLRLLATLASELKILLRARLLMDGQLKKVWKPGMNYPAFKNAIWEKIPDCPKFFGRVHPYRAFVSMTRASNLTLDRLMWGLSILHEVDVRLKTSSGNSDILMDSLIVDLC